MTRFIEIKGKIIYKYVVLSLSIISFACLIVYVYCYMNNSIPKNITIKVDEVSEFKSDLPITASFDEKSIGVISVDNKKIHSNTTGINLGNNFSLSSSKVGEYNANLKAYGLINLKSVNVKVIDDKALIVGGIPVGIYMETDGLLVLGTSKVKTPKGVQNSKATNIVKIGDYIYGLNGQKVNNKKEFIDRLNKCKDEEVTLRIKRNGEMMNVVVKRIYIKDNNYKLGIWIRNDMQGIGTMTYYNPSDKSYGALGHGINDVDTRTLMSVKRGTIYQSSIIDIIKGKKDNPGELVGIINQSDGCELGSLTANTDRGIYGSINEEQYKRFMTQIGTDSLKDSYRVGLKQDVRKGKAVIRCKIEDEIKEFDIVIEDINIKNIRANKGFVIKITDTELLNKTNGIVQGMSGSPVIQNGRIVGAVTHVLLNDSTRGYGIFIEDMLNNN